MHMDRKRALLLLVVVVLWTAIPALACFTLSTPPPCCQSMMQGCDDPAAMQGMACCQVHPSDSSVPPSTAAPCDFLLSMTQPAAWADALSGAASITGRPHPAAASPSPPLALSSILRI